MFERAVPFAMVCLVAFGGGTAAQPTTPEAKVSEKVICSMDIEAGQWPDQIEKRCLTRLSGMVAREGDFLRITLRDGTTKAFKDAPVSCGEPKSGMACIYYTPHGYYPENDAIAVERWLSGPAHFRLGVYMMERAAGRVVDLPNAPRFAPDGSRFVSVSACADHCANRIDIWSIQDGTAKLEWRRRIKQDENKTLAYEFVEWQGNEQVKLRILPEVSCECDAGKDVDEARAIVVSLTRTGQSWTLDPQLPQ